MRTRELGFLYDDNRLIIIFSTEILLKHFLYRKITKNNIIKYKHICAKQHHQQQTNKNRTILSIKKNNIKININTASYSYLAAKRPPGFLREVPAAGRKLDPQICGLAWHGVARVSPDASSPSPSRVPTV